MALLKKGPDGKTVRYRATDLGVIAIVLRDGCDSNFLPVYLEFFVCRFYVRGD